MSILPMMGRNRDARAQQRIEPQPAPYPPRPEPLPPGPQQLGSTSLAAVDAITEHSAADIDMVADGIEHAAHEEAEGLRELARRMRTSGALAQERLAKFVSAAIQCSDAARLMRERVERRAEFPPETEPTAEAQHEAAAPAPQPNLDAMEQHLAELSASHTEKAEDR